MSSFPASVLITPQVKALRDRVIAGDAPLTTVELLDLIGSHEQLRAIALATRNKLGDTEAERSRLQSLLETIARAR